MKTIFVSESWFYLMSREKEKIEKKSQDKSNFMTEHPVIFEIIKAFAPTVAVLLLGAVFGLYNDIKSIPAIQEQLKEEIAERKEQDESLDSDIKGIYTILATSNNNIRPTSLMEEEIAKEYNGIYLNGGQHTELTATSVVAYDERTGQEFTVEQLAGVKLLLPYVSEGQEIIFYGGFNSEGQWHGECTLNVYENNELVLITDAEYENGTRVKSKQVFSYELSEGEPVWALSNREYKDGISSGETYLYEWTNAYTKDFSLEDATIKDVLYANEFIENLNPRLKAYYYGDVSDGLFNDNSGDAYMAYFFDDGTVRLLYSGNFKDGTFNDNTGNAWYIVKAEDTDYMYYRGNFKNGEEDHSADSEVGHPPLTLEEINQYLGEREYNVELHWHGLGIAPSLNNNMI